LAARIALFASIVLSALGLATFYLGSRLTAGAPEWLHLPIWIALTVGVFIQPISMVLVRFDHVGSESAVRVFQWVAYLAMGLFSLLLSFTMAVDAALLGLGLLDRGVAYAAESTPVLLDATSRNALLGWLHLGVFGGSLGITTIGFFKARGLARTVEVDIPIDDLPEALEGFRIAQISDIHVGPTIRRPYLAAIVDRVNELEPDLIAITGDLVDGSVETLRDDVAPLADLRARHGSFFVTGNHEYYSGVRSWLAEVTRLGVKPLVNAHIVLHHEGAPMVVAGVTDYSAGHMIPAHVMDAERAVEGAPEEGTRLLLAHQPRSAYQAVDHGFDLMLAGHTHGGQYFPWTLLVTAAQPFTVGLHKLKQMWIYTSPGTGYWGPPIRFGSPSEITLLRLVRARS